MAFTWKVNNIKDLYSFDSSSVDYVALVSFEDEDGNEIHNRNVRLGGVPSSPESSASLDTVAAEISSSHSAGSSSLHFVSASDFFNNPEFTGSAA
jgi:hypothetical protein